VSADHPPTLAAALVAAAHRHPAARAGADLRGGPGPHWASIVSRARDVALGLRAIGLRRGDRVGLVLDDGAHGAALELGVWVAGGAVVPVPAAIGVEAAGHVLRGVGATWCVAERPDHTLGLVATSGEPPGDPSFTRVAGLGRQADIAQPDAFERLLAALAPDDPAVVVLDPAGAGEREAGFSHRSLHLGVQVLARAFEAPVPPAPAAPDAAGPVVVVGRWSDVTSRALGTWWPAVSGRDGHLVDHRGLAEATAGHHPAAVVADPEGWALLRERLRDEARRVPGGLRLLGYPADGRFDRAAHAGLRAALGGRLRDAVGLDACRLALVTGAIDERTRLDLAAVGIDVVNAWTPAGVVGPATVGRAPGGPEGGLGRPLPGRSVLVSEPDPAGHGELVVTGAGLEGGSGQGSSGRVDTGRHGWLDDQGNVHLDTAAAHPPEPHP
jgi:hypothetical protein